MNDKKEFDTEFENRKLCVKLRLFEEMQKIVDDLNKQAGRYKR